MRSSRRVKAILASASIFTVCGVANAVTDTWTGTVAPTGDTTYPDGTGNWDKTTANWSNGGTNLYSIGDNVIFPDNTTGFQNIAVAGTMNPNSMEFSHVAGNSTPVHYLFEVTSALSLEGFSGTSSSPWQSGITSPPTLTLDSGFLGTVELQARATSAADGGATFIYGGTLEIDDGAALPPYGTNNNPNVTLSGGTLEINVSTGGNTQPSTSQLAGNLNVLTNSTLQLGAINSSHMWGGTINLSPGATLFMNSVVSSADEMDLSATVLGAGTISLGNSSSVLRLDSANAGSVGVTYDTGTGTGILRNNLGNGGTMNLGALTGGAGTLLDGSESSATAATTYSIGALASSTFNGTIQDEETNGSTTSITKVGTSTLTLTNSNNTYSGITTVNQGTLVSTALGGTPFGVGAITLKGGVLAVAPSGTGSAITDTADTLGPGTQFTYAGGGTLVLNKGTQNSVTFLVGNSTPTVGKQVISRASQATLVIAPAGGTAATNLGVKENFLVNSTTVGNVPVVTNGIVNTSIVGQNNDANLSGDFLTYTTTKGFILASYTDHNFTAPTATSVELVNTAQNSLASTNVFALNASANIAMGAGKTLTIGNPGTGVGQSGQAGLILNGASISGSTSTLTFGAAEGTIYTSAANGSISTAITSTTDSLLTFFGPGTLTISGNDSDTGTHNINSGRVILTGNNSAATGATNVNQNATLQLQANAGNTSGGINNALSQNASQLQLLNNSTVQLRADAPTTFYNNFSGIAMDNKSVTFDVNQLTSTGTNNHLTFAPAGFTTSGTTINVTGGNGYSLALGFITTANNSVDTLDPTTAALTIPGFTSSNTIAGTATLDLDGTSAGNTVTGIISNSTTAGAVVALTKSNTSTWSLFGANTYTGATAINGGVLSLNNSSAIPSSSTISFAGGTLQFTSNNTNDYSGKILLNDATTAIIDTNSQSVTFARPFLIGTAKTGAFTKIGLGTLTVSAANTYTGVTTVNNGEFSATNTSGSATGTGNVVLNGGILASSTSGTITGNVLAGIGSHTIAPGGVGTIGTLSIGGVTSTSLTNFNFDLGTAVAPEITNGDLLKLGTGIVNVGAGTLMSFTGPTTIGDDYRLIGDTTSGAVVDAIPLTNFTLPTAPVGQAFSLSNSVDPGFIDLVVGSAGPASLTWNNTGANTPSDGRTWDINNNKNWNNGAAGNVVYTEPGGGNNPNVIFNDSNNITPGGTNANAYNVIVNTLVQPRSVVINNSAGNYTFGGSGGIAGSGLLTKSGSDAATLSTVNSYTGGTNVTGGTLIIATNGALPANRAVTLAGGNLQLALNTGGETVSSLSITGGSKLDLTNNHITINYGNPADQVTMDSTILGYLTSGAIFSSQSNSSYTIGWADGNDASESGIVAPNSVLVAYALYGDANLNGVVNGVDFTILVSNFGKSVSGWDKGDFNYDGVVNGVDFTELVQNIGKSASGADVTLPAADLASIDAFATANGLMADVPEPTCGALAALAAVGMFQRRRRTESSEPIAS